MEYDNILNRLKEITDGTGATPTTASGSIASTATEIPDAGALLLNAFHQQLLTLCDMAGARGVPGEKVGEWKAYAQDNIQFLFDEFSKLDHEKIKAKDMSFFSSFIDMDTVDTSKMEEVWDTLQGMSQNVTFNDLYKLCPPTMINKISKLAMSISGQIESGKMNAQDLNPLELGSALTSAMSKEDLAEFNKSLSGANLNIPGMMGLMNSMMKKI